MPLTTSHQQPSDLKPYHEALERGTKRITKDRATARRWLMKHGFVTREQIRAADEAERARSLSPASATA